MDNNDKNNQVILKVIQEKMKTRYYPLSYEEIVHFTQMAPNDVEATLKNLIQSGFVIYVQGQAIEGYMLKKDL